LGLDDPVSKYLPEFSASRVLTSPARNPDGSWQTTTATRPITVRDLFRHTAGLQYGFGLNDLDNEYFQFANAWQAPLSDFIGKIAVLPLAYQPGTQFSYSYSIDVLGRVIEVVSGKTLDVFLDEKVFRPLFMVDTAFYAPAGKVGRFSNFYASPDGSLVLKETAAASEFLVRPIGLSAGGGWATGYGGLVTTAPDFGRLLQMLLNKGELEGARILKPGTVDEMIKNQLLGIDRSTFFPPLPGGYGLGIGLEERADAPGKPLIFWGGAPYNTSFFADFRTGQYAIFLTQSGPWDKLYQPGGLHVEFRALALASVIQ
ncbi:MAG: class A beta-lactamase-related serine hydrolase, partial [Rhodocyclaceae bacterium]